MSKTLTIIDGHSQIFRAYYAPFRDLTSPTGEPTRATYVFCTMLLKLLAAKHPDYVAMAIDGPADKLHRRQVYSEYKATRKPVPEDFRPQEKRIFEIVRAMGIPILEAEGHEADDILATACEKLASDDLDVVLVSRDKDLDQLVNDHVVLYDPMNEETFDAEAIEKKKGYTPDQAVEIQTMMGDSSDNIPGVPGVGPKTALQLIAEYGSADGVLQEARRRKDLPTKELTGKLKGKLLERILEAGEEIDLSRRLVTLDRDVPVELPLDDMQYDPAQLAGVRKLFAELGFNRLFDQLADMGVPEADGSPVTTESRAVRRGRTCAADMTYRCVCTLDELDEVVSELANVDSLAIDTETTSIRPMWAELVGISLAW
jgi:DNA polymerase-1